MLPIKPLFSCTKFCSAFGFLCYNAWSYVQSGYWSLPKLSSTLFTWCLLLHWLLHEKAHTFLCSVAFLTEIISRCVFCCCACLPLCFGGRLRNTRSDSKVMRLVPKKSFITFIHQLKYGHLQSASLVPAHTFPSSAATVCNIPGNSLRNVV